MLIFQDRFTAGADQGLEAHAPDVGLSWTELYASTPGVGWNVDAALDRAVQDNAGDSGAIYTADAVYPEADYDITATLVGLGPSDTAVVYLFVRVQDVNNFYAVRLLRPTGGPAAQCQLYKKVAGNWTNLGSAFAAPANGSVVKLEIIGTTLSFYDDGAIVAQATATGIAAAGKAGIGGGGGGPLLLGSDDLSSANILDDLSVNRATTGSVAVAAAEVNTVTPAAALANQVAVAAAEANTATVAAALADQVDISASEVETVTISAAVP